MVYDPGYERWNNLTEFEKLCTKDPMIQFFAFDHLPEHLRVVSANFAQLAGGIVNSLPKNPERTVALRKLLEAKDAAVRSVIYKGSPY